MLFDSIVEQVIKKTYSDTIEKATQQRKDECLKRLEYFYDDQMSYLQAQLAKVYADSTKITPVFINLTRKVILNISRVYSYPVKREIQNGTTRDAEIFSSIVESSALPRKLKQASRLTKLLKTTLIRPCWRNDHMDLDILDGSIVDVTWGDVPEDLQSVLISLYPQSGKREEIQYSLWTPQRYKLLDYMGNPIQDLINPYNVLPFITCWDRSPSSEYWLEGGDDLIVCQDAVNERLSDLLFVVRMQGFGVPTVIGSDKLFELNIGPGSAISLPKDSSFSFQSTNAPLAEIVKTIQFLIGQLAISYGLSAHTLISEPTQESGISKLISSQELDEQREDDKILWQSYEHKLFDLMKVIWNYHTPTKQISDKAQLSIEFRDPKPQVNQVEQSTAWQNLLNMQVISQVDIAMALNPDLKTREDALAYLLQVEQERATLTERTL